MIQLPSFFFFLGVKKYYDGSVALYIIFLIRL